MVVILHLCQLVQLHTGDLHLRQTLENWRPVWDLGRTGVHLFFVLSGYLLFQPFVRWAEGGTQPRLVPYAVRRALRILPAYYACLLVVVAGGFAIWRLPDAKSWDVLLHVLLIHNWNDATRESISPPFWTMAVEAQFYVLLPLVGVVYSAVARGAGLRWGRMVIASLIPLSVVAHAAIKVTFTDSAWYATHHGVFLLIAYYAPFGVGILLATMPSPSPRTRQILPGAALLAIVALLGHGLLLAGGAVLGASDLYPFNLVVAVCFGVLTWATLHGQVSRPLSFGPLTRIGLISYSVYLWHYPLLEAVAMPLVSNQSVGSPLKLVGLSTLLIVPTISFVIFEERVRAVGVRLLSGGQARD